MVQGHLCLHVQLAFARLLAQGGVGGNSQNSRLVEMRGMRVVLSGQGHDCTASACFHALPRVAGIAAIITQRASCIHARRPSSSFRPGQCMHVQGQRPERACVPFSSLKSSPTTSTTHGCRPALSPAYPAVPSCPACPACPAACAVAGVRAIPGRRRWPRLHAELHHGLCTREWQRVYTK